MNTETKDVAPANGKTKRNRLLLLVTLGILVIAIGYGGVLANSAAPAREHG